MPQSHSDQIRLHWKKLCDAARKSASKRGYDRRWRRYCLFYLASHPLCNCGCGRPATDVDHIQPVTGPDDPLFWEHSNHQALAHECHSRKTMRESVHG